MTLSALIRKRESRKVATAISAIPATQPKEEDGTVAKIATVAVANPAEAKTAPMIAEEETAIRAWCNHIGEDDQPTIAEVVHRCQSDLNSRRHLLELAKEVPEQATTRQSVICGECVHFERIEHPHLGHCAQGEPEAIAGLWDTDRRYCKQYQVIQKRGK